jgi:hypothetical protein
LCLLALPLLAMSAAKKPVVANEFNAGDFYVTPVLGINSYTVPFGVNVEYAITANIGIGGTAMYWHWSDFEWGFTVISLEGEAAYHFTELKVEKLDLYAGLGIGYDIFSSSGTGFTYSYGSGVFFDPFVACRYYFSDTIAGYAKMSIGFGGNFNSFGGVVGVTFKLK